MTSPLCTLSYNQAYLGNVVSIYNLTVVSDKNFMAICVLEYELQMFYHGDENIGKPQFFSKLRQS